MPLWVWTGPALGACLVAWFIWCDNYGWPRWVKKFLEWKPSK